MVKISPAVACYRPEDYWGGGAEFAGGAAEGAPATVTGGSYGSGYGIHRYLGVGARLAFTVERREFLV
jgi:hypothetical protein